MSRLFDKTLPRFFVVCVMVAGPLAPSLLSAEDKAEDGKTAVKKVTFEDDVKPIFRAKCQGCHNPDKKSGGLDLTSYTAMMQGGSSGQVIDPGELITSYLYDLISHESEPFMPPNQERLPDETLAVVKSWIELGALENASSKAAVKEKPKFAMTLDAVSSGRPEGPPPMPEKLSLQPVVTAPRTTALTALATSPWAPLAAIAGQKQILLYNTQSLELLGVLPFPEGVPHVLKFSRNGSLLLAGGGRGAYQGLVAVYDVKTGERIIEVGDEVDVVLGADINSQQTLIALGSPSKMVRVYSTETGEKLYEIKKHTDWVTSVAFSPDGVLLATGDRNGGLHVWEAFTGRPYLTLNGHNAMISDLSWRPDSNMLASASEDASIKLWEMTNGNQVKTWGAHGGGTASVEFTRDGRLVSCGRDKTAKMWDQNGGAQRTFEAFADLALQVTYCDETNRVIAGSWLGEIRVWEAGDGKRSGELTSNPPRIEDRLAAAESELKSRQDAHTKLAAAAQAAQQALEKTQTDLKAAQQAVTTAQQQNQTATAAVATADGAVKKLTAEQAEAQQKVTTLKAELQAAETAAAQAAEAAAKATDDKALAEAAEKAKAAAAAKKTEAEAADKLHQEKTAALTKAQQDLQTAQKQVQESAAAIKAGQERVNALTANLKPAGEQAAAAKKAADEAASALQAAQQSVARWQQALQFEQQLEKEVATN